jgi:hypothetical protein
MYNEKMLVIIGVIISFDLIAQDYKYCQIAFERFISTSDGHRAKVAVLANV